jgi:hypothetical protein
MSDGTLSQPDYNTSNNSTDSAEPVTDLLPQHAQMLKASAIRLDVIAARGYRSVGTKAELRRLEFAETQRLVPALLIPIHSVNGGVALHHHRPDQPRIHKGKPVKYEFPAGAHMAVDVHPFIRENVRDPKLPLFITEGVKKADAAISLGLCCIALIGTWNWRGTNEHGGKTTLPDWHSIALKDSKDHPRLVYICYDSDVMTKPQVYKALAELSNFLKSKGAYVLYIYLPAGVGAAKTGLDDYIAQGHGVDDLLALATPELRSPPVQSEDNNKDNCYRETERGLVWVKPTRDGTIEQPLTNFTARIASSIIEDDGAETSVSFEMNASHNKRAYRFRVPATSFNSMNWPLERIGAGAVVYPGMGLRDQARAAIQLLSGNPPERRVYKHTGWREIEPGNWVFLHANGAIQPSDSLSTQEPSPVCVQLVDSLSRIALPLPQDGRAVTDAIRATLRLWDLGPDEVTIPIFGGIYRAAIGNTDFSLWLAGPSGAFKSELAALAQQHFGRGMDARHLLASWSSTDNALEGTAFATKDVLMVIDDYAPIGSAQDVNRLNAKVDRIMRGQGNGSGRQRMKADGSLRPQKPPRGLILSTGEDIPPGVSLRGRMLILELSHGHILPKRLSECQKDAVAGLYAQAMSNFLAWLAPRYVSESVALQERVLQLRASATDDSGINGPMHRRTPQIMANLACGVELFLRFAKEAGALSAEEVTTLFERAWVALIKAEQKQSAHQTAIEPTRRFLELLSTALASGKSHLTDVEGNKPTEPTRFGWRAYQVGTGDYQRTDWRPQGDSIGWVNEATGDLWLEPDAALAVVKRIANDTGDSFTITRTTLCKRLKERGLLLSIEHARETLTVRRKLAGATHAVLHLAVASVLPVMPEKPDISGITDIETYMDDDTSAA